MRIFVTRTAFKDLSGIWTFIAKDSPDAADRVLDELHAAMRKLATFREWAISAPT